VKILLVDDWEEVNVWKETLVFLADLVGQGRAEVAMAFGPMRQPNAYRWWHIMYDLCFRHASNRSESS